MFSVTHTVCDLFRLCCLSLQLEAQCSRVEELTTSASEHSELQKKYLEVTHREEMQEDTIAELRNATHRLEEDVNKLRSSIAVQDVKYKETSSLLEQERKEVVRAALAVSRSLSLQNL